MFEILQSNSFTHDFVELRARKVDLALAILRPLADGLREDLNVERLFEEEWTSPQARAIDGPGVET